MREPGPCYSPWEGRGRVAGLREESRLPWSRNGNSSSPGKPEHAWCKAQHPSPARLGLCLLPLPAAPRPSTAQSSWPQQCRKWGRKKEVWKMLTFNIDPQMTGSPEEPHIHQIAQGSVTERLREQNLPAPSKEVILYQWHLFYIFVYFPGINRCDVQPLHTCVSSCSSVGPAWGESQASKLLLGVRTRFPQCFKPSFLISSKWQEAFPWKVWISKFGELGTYSLILDSSHKYGEMWNSMSRAKCQDCPLHRQVGTVLHSLGLSAHHLASDTTAHANDTAR